MGKDKAKTTAPEPTPAPVPAKQGRGHRQRGAGTVITAKPAVVTGDGVVLKVHERLPSQLLNEYCQGQKRPTPSYYPDPPGNKFRVVLRDGKNDKNDLTFSTPQAFETSSMARDFAALLALFHLQRSLPLERRLPEPYGSTWLSMVAKEKEQSGKADSKAAKGAPTAAAPAAAKKDAKDTKDVKASTASASAAAGADGVVQGGKGSTSAPAAVPVVVLNRETADWLCDSCGNQNFAKLASGAPRVRCFKCQAPKSDTCQLVASTAAATTAPASTATTGSGATAPGAKVVVLRSQAAAAPVDLLSGSKAINPVSRAEAERAQQEKRAAARRKQLYFDALRRANRPHIVHIPPGLRSKLERLLGIVNGSGGSGADDSDALSLEDVLQTYRESGIFDADSCNISTAQQTAILERVTAKLAAEGFASQYVASSLHEVLLQSANDLLDDALDATEGSDSSSTAAVVQSFEKLLTEALLKHLCMTVDESQLPEAYNPKRFQTKKLSVVPTGAGSTDSAAPPAEPPQQPQQDIAVSTSDPVASEAHSLSGQSMAACLAAVDAARALLAIDKGAGDSTLLALIALIVLQEAPIWSTAQDASPVLATLRESLVNHALTTSQDGYEPFLEELESLQAIFEEGALAHRLVQGAGSGSYHEVTLRVSLEHLGNRKDGAFGKVKELCLRIIVHSIAAYPQHPPLVFVTAKDGAANAQVTARLRQLEHSLRNKALELVGEGMIFQLHSYLQECVDSADSDSAVAIGADEGSVAQLRAYLSGQEVPPPTTAKAVPTTAVAQDSTMAPDTVTGDDASVATTHITMASEDSSRTAGTSITAPVGARARGGKGKGPGLQSFWSPLPPGPITPAKVPDTPQAAEMTRTRQQLPAYAMRDEVLQLVQNHRGIVVTGETGCGKTTQVPQYLYEQNCQQKILICQPRRLAAVGVATRVAEEVGCALGEQVGYMVKGDSQISQHTRIAFCTYGVMLRRLQQDPTLQAVSTVVLDEVHERGLDSDFTLALLMFALARRTDLKLILMSATISTEHFAAYLRKWLKVDTVPIMHIPGFTYPVREFYKADYEQIVRDFRDFIPTARQADPDDDAYDGESPYAYQIGGRPRKGDLDYDLLTKLVMVLARGALRDREEDKQLSGMFAPAHGSILVFMPGVPEIARLSRLLEAHYKSSGGDGGAVPRLKIIPLHGNLSPSEQRVVFKPANKGEIKVVIATNVAEASVTIPDVTVVVDTCRVKEISFDAEIQTSALMMKFAAQDSLRQRRGRAGRVQKGRCFRLITRGTYDKLPAHSVPEILRVPLEKVVLQVKAMLGSDKSAVTAQGGAEGRAKTSTSSMVLLCRCPDVPSEASVQAAEQLLAQIQALNAETGLLTPLGRHLSTLPCMPRVGKLCIYGALLGCVYPATAVAACMTVRSPFLSSNDPDVQRRVKAAKDQFSGGATLRSDYTMLVNALQEYDRCRSKRRFCQDYGLAFERMNELKDTQEDLLSGLVDLGLLGSVKEGLSLGSETANRNVGKTRLVTATLCAGLYPQLAKILRPTKRFVEVSGGTFERDSLAKELKFYIPKNLASPTATDSGESATAIQAGAAAKGAVDKRNVDISTDDLFRVFLHPSSCNFDNFSFKESNFVMYGERQLVTYPSGSGSGSSGHDSKVYLRDTTEAPAFALMFFGGQLQADYSEGTVTVDGWIRFTAPGRIVAILQELRSAFDALLARKFDEPALDIAGQPVVELTCQLLDVNAQY